MPHPSTDNPLVSMGPCPEILLVDQTITFRRPYPQMAMIGRGKKDAIFVYFGQERPGVKGDVDGALIERYETFNQRKVRTVSYVDLELDGWRYLGKCKGEVYISPKANTHKNQEWVHEHSSPKPDCYINGDGTVYAIVGGKFHIDEWIED